jgi:Outer membrane protein (OmpH-like)
MRFRWLITISCSILISLLAWLDFIEPVIAGSSDTKVVWQRNSIQKPGATIVWLNLDTITEKYLAFQDLIEKHDSTGKKIVDAREKELREYASAHDRYLFSMMKGLLPVDELLKKEIELVAMEKHLNLLDSILYIHDSIAMFENSKINEDVYKFLNQYGKHNHFDYIIANGNGSPIMYANEYLDITIPVLTILNRQYRMQHPK